MNQKNTKDIHNTKNVIFRHRNVYPLLVFIMGFSLLILCACGNPNQEDASIPPDSQGSGTAVDSSGQNQGNGFSANGSGITQGSNASAESSGQDSYTFTDDLGRTVTVTSCARTAALLGSYADVWMLAGGTVCATADDAWYDFELKLAEDTVNLGQTKSLSLESLLAADPDFVLASTNTSQHLEWQQTLEEAGITVAYFDVTDFDDYLRMLKVCTDLTGRTDIYKTCGTDLREKIQDILERNREQPAQSVLVLRASATFIRAKNSDGTVLGPMLRDFGCTNIADDDDTLLENLSIESIALANPDRIFFIPSGDDTEGMEKNIRAMFDENPLWNELDAVKNNRVYYMDKHLYGFKPNARWAEAYEHLEEILYEE